ncbi:MAG TPA: LysR family transcriptional regulator [Acidocella sp.]|jgi:DNA-binding transcriptional LysR family regulator|nr:LysR family transcriptional regulator [Acidocella sp.]
MELSQVRYFIALCKTLNFTRAAECCNVTQPAFTRAIQKLEMEFGGALIFRERNLTQLTELGRGVRPHLEAMIEAAEAATALANAKMGRAGSSLKIGLGPGIGAASIASAVREVTTKLPDVTIHFEESGAATLIEAMLMDMLDCALLPEFVELPERLNRWPLYTDRALAVLPPDHDLNQKNSVTAEDVVDEPILMGENCGGFAKQLAETTGFALQLQRCNGAATQLLDLVAAGLGMALMSDRLRYAAPLTTRPFHEPELQRKILLTSVAGRPLNVAAASFVKLCRVMAFT